MKKYQLGTQRTPWINYRHNLATGHTGQMLSGFQMSSIASGGSWGNRKNLVAVNISDLTRGDPVNGVMIRPYGCPAPDGGNLKFQVGVYNGKYGVLERICLMSATTGKYIASTHSQGKRNTAGEFEMIDAGGSTAVRFCDTLVATKDYINDVTIVDGAGNDGAGYIKFDMTGAATLVINVISSYTGSTVRYGFDIAGY